MKKYLITALLVFACVVRIPLVIINLIIHQDKMRVNYYSYFQSLSLIVVKLV